MKNQSKDKSYFDEKLKQLEKDIIWKENRKSELENEILITMESQSNRYKTKLFTGLIYASSIGVMVIILFFGYNFLSDSITHQGGESSTGNQGNQTNNNPIISDRNEKVEKENPENDENQVNSKGVVEDKETDMEIHTGSSESVIRKVEGRDMEINVINYHIENYGIAYHLDDVFVISEVSNNQVIYSTQYDDYKISLEMIEYTNLEKSVLNLQEKFETEGYEESFELESTSLEENALLGKMQFFVYPVKGFIAYEIDEHVLVITFQYPEEAGDGMYPLLEGLRKSIHVE